MEAKKKLKMMTLDQMKDKHLGKVGNQKRDQYEFELKLDLIGEMIKKNKEGKKPYSRRIRKIDWRTKSTNFKIGKRLDECYDCNYLKSF